MQKTLYLHIGTEKTGSTALQVMSAKNRAALMDRGIFYPRTPGERNHIKLTLFAAEGAKIRDLRRMVRLASDEDHARFKANFARELESETAASKCPHIVLSNEHLSSRIKRPGEVGQLAAALRPLAEAVKIVVYLRPQHELFLSTYSTAIKTGRTEIMEPPTRVQDPRYNYDRKLSLWADQFGEENVIVRIYDRNTLVGGDVVKDFFSIMGCDPGSAIESPTRLNTRLDHHALQFLLEFNKHVPQFRGEDVNPDRGDIASALSTGCKGDALAIPAAVLRRIAKTFEESNARVARRFLGREDGKLFAEMDHKDHEGEDGPLTAERAVEISARLWRWNRQELAKMKGRLSRVKTKLKTSKPA